jgi:hypothetical protein
MSTTLSTALSSDSPPYATRDLHMASFFAALGHQCTIAGEPHQRVFVFRDLPLGAVADYFQAPCPISAAAIFSSYATLRKRLFSVAP